MKKILMPNGVKEIVAKQMIGESDEFGTVNRK